MPFTSPEKLKQTLNYVPTNGKFHSDDVDLGSACDWLK